jgi:glycosyltransferase involved in cell wall biosynthesis
VSIGFQIKPIGSVVIYVKNGAETIAEAIESVVNQDCAGWQLIAIDGASSDGTVEVVRRYAAHFAHIISEPDSGAFEAANKGIALATGEVLVLLMADDWLEPGALKEIAAAFAADPDCDLVSSGVKVVREAADGGFHTVTELGGTANALTLENVLYVPYSLARYYRRRALERVGGLSASYPVGHDRELLLRMLALGVKERIIERPLYVYRQHGASNTLVFKPRTYRKIYDEHLRMALQYAGHQGFGAHDRQTLKDWAAEQYVRWSLLELRQGALASAIRIGFAGELYRPSAWSSIRRRIRTIRARRRLLAQSAGAAGAMIPR